MVVKGDFATYSFFYLQKPFARLQASGFGNQLSLVEHLVWDQGVAGSNPVFPIKTDRGQPGRAIIASLKSSLSCLGSSCKPFFSLIFSVALKCYVLSKIWNDSVIVILRERCGSNPQGAIMCQKGRKKLLPLFSRYSVLECEGFLVVMCWPPQSE